MKNIALTFVLGAVLLGATSCEKTEISPANSTNNNFASTKTAAISETNDVVKTVPVNRHPEITPLSSINNISATSSEGFSISNDAGKKIPVNRHPEISTDVIQVNTITRVAY